MCPKILVSIIGFNNWAWSILNSTINQINPKVMYEILIQYCHSSNRELACAPIMKLKEAKGVAWLEPRHERRVH